MSRRKLLKVVIDPGVLVSAALTGGGPPDRLLGSWVAGDLDVVACPHLLGELERVLQREKFRPFLPSEEADRFVEAVGRAATIRSDPVVQHGATPDPKDDYLPSLAGEAAVDYLVSGNTKHLAPDLTVHPPVVTPAQLFDLLPMDRSTAGQRTPRRSAQLAAWRAGRAGRSRAHGRDPGGRGGMG